jgi:hypothetical protein
MPKRRSGFILLLSVLGLIVSACSPSVYQVETTAKGCTGLLPATAMTEHGVNVEVAQVAIQEISVGKVAVGYEETIKPLLSDAALDAWVKEEIVCQASKSFDSPQEKMWFLTMKEVAATSSGSELIK